MTDNKIVVEQVDRDAAVEDARLWCMHVSGSDDVHPAPDRATAQLWAAQFTFCQQQRNPAPHPYDPVTNFTVQPWPWSAEAHADGLSRSITDNTWSVCPFAAHRIAERERCAQVAEDDAGDVYPTDPASIERLATTRRIATAIRKDAA